jgi:TetR/AcrR family transcriptional regulator
VQKQLPKPRRQGRPARESGHDGRAQLLDAAIRLFAERGIAATTFVEIGAHAGVTAAMVHYYFKNREQLLDAVVEERLQPFISAVWDPVTENGDDPLTMLRGVVHRIIEAADQMPCVPSLWVQEVLSESGMLRERVLKRLPVGSLAHLSACLSTAQHQGSINPDIDPGLIVLSVLGLTMMPLAAAKIWSRLPHGGALNKNTLARHVTALLAHVLSKPPQRTARSTASRIGERNAKHR